MKKNRILLQIDEKYTASLIKTYLHKLNYNLSVHCRVEEALKEIITGCYSVIILDYDVFYLFNTDFFYKAKEHNLFEFLILLVSNISPPEMQNLYECQLVDKILEKPVCLPYLKYILHELNNDETSVSVYCHDEYTNYNSDNFTINNTRIKKDQ